MSAMRVALVEACTNGDLEKIKALFLETSKPSKEDLRGTLSYPIRRGYYTIVKFLLENGAEIDDTTTAAARKCRSRAVFQTLLDYGWDINNNTRNCSVFPLKPTLWHIVDDEDLTKWFLEHGADPSLNPDGEASPLDRAARVGTPAIISLLLQHGAKLENSNALQCSADGAAGIPMMSFLLDSGADINAFDISNRPPSTRTRIGTALHVASKYGHRDRVQFLIDRGANRELRHPDKVLRMNAAEWAQKHRQTEIYEMLTM